LRIIKGLEATVRLRVEDEGGTLVPAASLPTLEVLASDGQTVSGVSSVTQESVGVYKATIPPQSDLDLLVANWSFSVSGSSYTRVRSEDLVICEERVVPLWRLRMDDELADLSTVNLLRLVEEIEVWAYSALGFAPVPQAFSRTWRANFTSREELIIPGVTYPVELRRVTVDGVELDLDDLRYGGNGVWRSGGANDSFLTGLAPNRAGWRGGLYEVVGVEGPRPDWHGGVPQDLVEALVTLARYVNRGSNYPERATQISDESTLIMFSTPGPGRPTGLPEVDGVITRWSVQHQL
jgi:hypothetical protein